MIWPSQNFKKTVLRGRHAKFMDCSCQTRVSRQTCIKNWILWQLPLKNNICTPAINHRWCLVILICASVFKIEIFFVGDVYRTFVPIKFSYISPYKHYEMAFALVPHSCQNLHFKSCLLILWKRRNTTMAISIILSQPCCTQIILCGLRMIPFVSKLDCSMLL